MPLDAPSKSSSSSSEIHYDGVNSRATYALWEIHFYRLDTNVCWPVHTVELTQRWESALCWSKSKSRKWPTDAASANVRCARSPSMDCVSKPLVPPFPRMAWFCSLGRGRGHVEPKSTYVVRHVLIKVELRLYAHCPRSTVMTQAHVMSGFGPTPIDAR